MPYLCHPQPIDEVLWQAATALPRPLLAEQPIPSEALHFLEDNHPGLNSVLPFIAWQLKQSGQIEELAPETQLRLMTAMRHQGAFHLLQEHEFKQMLQAFDEQNIRILLIKGHAVGRTDRKSTRLNSSHLVISYAVF